MSNKELFKQALVEGVSRHFDKTIEEEKQIEEMIEIVKPFVSGLTCEEESGFCELIDCRNCNARNLSNKLYNAEYRKQSEVARKIFDELDTFIVTKVIDHGTLSYDIGDRYVELKKKYLGENINVHTKEKIGILQKNLQITQKERKRGQGMIKVDTVTSDDVAAMKTPVLHLPTRRCLVCERLEDPEASLVDLTQIWLCDKCKTALQKLVESESNP